MTQDKQPHKVNLNIESSDAPYLYRVKWGDRTVVADHDRVWVIDVDGKMTNISPLDGWLTLTGTEQ